jgi:hypothetical protein
MSSSFCWGPKLIARLTAVSGEELTSHAYQFAVISSPRCRMVEFDDATVKSS